MRLVLSIRIVIGFAVVGAAAIGLSGDVLAADGSLVTTPQAPTIKIQLAMKDSLVDEAVNASVQNVDEPKGFASEADRAVVLSGKVPGDAQASSAITTQPAVASELAAVNVLEKSPTSKVGPVASQALVNGGTGLAPIVPLVQAEQNTQVARISAPRDAVAQVKGAVASGSLVELPIQPVITNRTAALAEDLAAAMPSAPAPIESPAPAKSMGLLGRLKAELAGIVMPQLFTIHSLPLERPTAALAVIGLVVLLSHTFAFTYGLWLRRAGFANAARSDVPDNFFSSLIATPFLLSYVSALSRRHSSFSMVAEIKNTVIVPNAIRKEEM